MFSEISQTQKDGHCDSTHVRTLGESGSQRQKVGGGGPGLGEGEGSECLMGTVSVRDDENIPEMDGGDGCTTV